MNYFELQHAQNKLIISDFTHYKEQATAENPYNTVFLIKAVSGGFYGVAPRECDIAEFRRFAVDINDLYLFKRSEVTFQEIGYGSKITFTADKTGHITVKGELYGEAMLHHLTFSFEADQTSLKPFAEALGHVL